MGGLWAAAPRIALGVPPVSWGAPAHPPVPAPLHGPGVAAGSAGSTKGWESAWGCSSGRRTPQMWGSDAAMSGEGTPRVQKWSPLCARGLQLGTSALGFCGCSVGHRVPPCPPFLTIFILAILILTLLQDQVLSRSRRFFPPPCASQPGGQNLPPASLWVKCIPKK